MSRHRDIFVKMAELEEAEEPFAVATIISVKGSSSGRMGDKAIFGSSGERVAGWIGGGCVENRVARTTVETLADGEPRIVNIDLDSDQMGMGIPCGGSMSIIVEPQLKTPTILIRGMGRLVEVLARLGKLLNFSVVVQTSKEEASRFPETIKIVTEPLELDELDFSVDFLVLATHHRDDDKLSLQALKMGVPFVAVVASRKKTGIIMEYLKSKGVTDEDLDRFHAPAGLDLNAKTPEEIALSIMSEMVMHRNSGSGEPMRSQTAKKPATR
ncbi:MAG: XdhC family protein [Candidatus Neomarinimicrobiota bacterium]